MPTPITRAPTPDVFAKAFAQAFGDEVKKVAGTDGRLNANEASRVAEPYRDNALNFLAHTGQQSVSVQKLIGSAERYAFVQADKVKSARSGTVSLSGGRKIAGDLRTDFFALRGKLDKLTAVQRRDLMLAQLDGGNAPAQWVAATIENNLSSIGGLPVVPGSDEARALFDAMGAGHGVNAGDVVTLAQDPVTKTRAMIHKDGADSKVALFDRDGARVGVITMHADGSHGWSR